MILEKNRMLSDLIIYGQPDKTAEHTIVVQLLQQQLFVPDGIEYLQQHCL